MTVTETENNRWAKGASRATHSPQGFIQDFQFGGRDVVRGLTGMSEYFSHHAQKWC